MPDAFKPCTIRRIRKSDIVALVDLHFEFERYLRSFDKKRKSEPRHSYEERLLHDGFGNHRSFNGLIAKDEKRAVGYAFYHAGYDPDEMRGRVLYLIDLYVLESMRKKGIGSQLMLSLARECRKMQGIDLYFGVWVKNKTATAFYKKLGAVLATEVPFMHWKKEIWLKQLQKLDV